MSDLPANVTRNQLAEFLPNQRLIRAFEQLLRQVNKLLPDDIAALNLAIEVAATEASSANAKANLINGLPQLVDQALIEAGNASAGVNMCLSMINAMANDFNLAPQSILDTVTPLIAGITLQKAYSNSSDPEILTDTVRRAFTVKIGTGSNTDNTYEGLNVAGTITFSVNGFGDVLGRQINGVTLTNAGTGLNLLADDGAYYPYTDFAAPLQNCYNNSIPPEILTAPGIDAVIFRRGTASDSDDVIAVQNNATTKKFAVTGDGRVYGTALHNNAGSITGTANQYITSGTYTPTLTNVTNVAASTARQCQWMRVGNVVTVSGQLNIDLTTTLLASEIGMSLPIASALTTAYQLGGTANAVAFQATWAIQADAANDRAQFKSTGIVDVGNDTYTFTFTYEIL